MNQKSYESQIVPSCIHQVDDSVELTSANTGKNQDVGLRGSEEAGEKWTELRDYNFVADYSATTLRDDGEIS